jgi:hypothetical protein
MSTSDNSSSRQAVVLSSTKRSQFDKLASEAKILENKINRLVASFEEKNNLTCYTIPVNRNSIELVISTDVSKL